MCNSFPLHSVLALLAYIVGIFSSNFVRHIVCMRFKIAILVKGIYLNLDVRGNVLLKQEVVWTVWLVVHDKSFLSIDKVCHNYIDLDLFECF